MGETGIGDSLKLILQITIGMAHRLLNEISVEKDFQGRIIILFWYAGFSKELTGTIGFSKTVVVVFLVFFSHSV